LENEDSNRRRFFHKIVRLGAIGGIATLLLDRLTEKTIIPPVHATDMVIDGVNTGTGTTELDSSVSSGSAFKAVATAAGVNGVNGVATTGNGVLGQATDPTAGTGVGGYGPVGVFGRSDAASGLGVYGLATGAGGIAVNAVATGSGGTRGVYAEVSSISGIGVYGKNTATSGMNAGVVGRSDGDMGTGASGTGGYVGLAGYAGTPSAVPIIARGTSGQTANLQEWQVGYPAYNVAQISKDGWLGIGASPARQLHIQGNQAVSRMDRDVDSAAFIFVRTAPGNFGTVWKSFMFGADASGVNNGRFVIGDLGTAVSGISTKRLVIDNTGRVGIGTETPTELLHVAGNVRATSFITGDIVLSNNFIVTEDEKAGVAFKNDEGEKIAVLDRKGNLYVKGEVRSLKDL